MAVTTDITSMVFRSTKLVALSSAYNTTTLTTESYHAGMRVSTIADTIIRFPIQEPQSKAFLIGIWAGVSSVAYSPQIDIAFGNNCTDPAWAGRNVVYSSAVPSTANAAWDQFISTAVMTATATESGIYGLGPLDLSKYVMNFGGASSAIQDAYENFIYVMTGQSTKGANEIDTHQKISTGDAAAGVRWIGLLECGDYK